jgi:uncharacterized protein (DUF305 family)
MHRCSRASETRPRIVVYCVWEHIDRISRFMTATTQPRLCAALLVSLAVGACSPATSIPPATPAPGNATAPAAPPSDAEFEAIFRARVDSARGRYTDADVLFMTGMIHHHAQAIEMSRMAPDHTTDPTIHTLAARIINAQRDEIATMQRWLRDRDQPVPELHVSDAGVMVHGGDHMHMPGMLTPAQIGELRAARGDAFDRLFLTLMIQHHNGAVEMVHTLFATDGAGQDEDVFRFASDVQVDQITEVRRMRLMLAERESGS